MEFNMHESRDERDRLPREVRSLIRAAYRLAEDVATCDLFTDAPECKASVSAMRKDADKIVQRIERRFIRVIERDSR
jgi:hypothetical protein